MANSTDVYEDMMKSSRDVARRWADSAKDYSDLLMGYADQRYDFQTLQSKLVEQSLYDYFRAMVEVSSMNSVFYKWMYESAGVQSQGSGSAKSEEKAATSNVSKKPKAGAGRRSSK